jgi:hypothetical protein
MVEEELDLKELLCYSAGLKTLETPLYSQEIQKELLLEMIIYIYHYKNTFFNNYKFYFI